MSGGIESMAAFARRLGVARSTITRAAQAGRLSLTPDGQVRIAESLARWHDTRGGRDDVADRHAATRGAAIPGPAQAAAGDPAPAPHLHPRPTAENAATARLPAPAAPFRNVGNAGNSPPAAPADDDGPEAADPGPLRAKLQAQRWHWRNALVQLEMDLESGARLDRAAAIAQAAALGGTLRAAIERLIDQTAPRLAAATHPADRRRILQQQIGAIRRELRREFPAALRRLQSQAGDAR